MSQQRPAPAKSRRIEDKDLPAVAELLSRGFKFRPPAYWLRGLERQAQRPRPANYPTYGYLLESGGRVVGAILLFFTELQTPEGPAVRCNLSSWYVEPAFRSFGSMLVTSVIRDKSVTYFNVSPAPNTWKSVEAQGFSAYCTGESYLFPALMMPASDLRVRPLIAADRGMADYDLLAQHENFGCLSLVAEGKGETMPFVFQRQRIKRVVPLMRLIYCRDIADFARAAGNLGRYLLRHGMPLVVADTHEQLAHIPGFSTEKRGRKYARGPHIPKLGDLAFTESVFFNS
jgi:hypothetical protein